MAACSSSLPRGTTNPPPVPAFAIATMRPNFSLTVTQIMEGECILRAFCDDGNLSTTSSYTKPKLNGDYRTHHYTKRIRSELHTAPASAPQKHPQLKSTCCTIMKRLPCSTCVMKCSTSARKVFLRLLCGGALKVLNTNLPTPQSVGQAGPPRPTLPRARLGLAGLGWTWVGLAWLGWARLGSAGFGWTRLGLAGLG